MTATSVSRLSAELPAQPLIRTFVASVFLLFEADPDPANRGDPEGRDILHAMPHTATTSNRPRRVRSPKFAWQNQVQKVTVQERTGKKREKKVQGSTGTDKKGLLYVCTNSMPMAGEEKVWVKKLFKLSQNTLYQIADDGSTTWKEHRVKGSSTSFQKQKLMRPNGEWTSIRHLFQINSVDDQGNHETLMLASRTKDNAEQWCKALHDASLLYPSEDSQGTSKQYQSPLARAIPAMCNLWQRGMKRVRGEGEECNTCTTAQDPLHMSPATATSHYKSLRLSTKKRRVIPSQETLDLAVQLGQVLESAGGNDWRQVHYENGVRVLIEGRCDQSPCSTEPFGVIKSSVIVRTTPLEVFKLVKDIGGGQQFNWDYSIRSAKLVEEVDADSDIIQIKYRSAKVKGCFLGVCSIPMLVAPRDICIRRFWREDEDGTFSLTYYSVEHEMCPPAPGYVRAWIYGGGFTIAPKAPGQRCTGIEECLVSHVLHIDAKGWSPLWGAPVFESEKEWLRPFFSSLAGLRDFVEQKQFLSEHLHDTMRAMSRAGSTGGTSARAKKGPERIEGSLSGFKRNLIQVMEDTAREAQEAFGSLDASMWSNSDAAFQVRGTTYLQDKKKVLSHPPLMQVIAVDLFEFPTPEEHVASRAESALQKLQHSEGRPLLAVNFMLPGPPHVCLVFYMQLKEEYSLSQNMPSIALLKYFLEADDRFRDGHFKIIPKVVQGSWVVKQGVGNSPAVVGKKLRQAYHRGDGYLEIDIDLGSSSVAGAILNMVSGLSKKLVVDVAVLFEADSPDCLPERLLAAIRFCKVDLTAAVKLPSSHCVDLQVLRKQWKTPNKCLRQISINGQAPSSPSGPARKLR